MLDNALVFEKRRGRSWGTLRSPLSLLSKGLAAIPYAWKLGAFLCAKGHATDGLKQMLYPVGYWRFWVNATLIEQYRKLKPKAVLDVSSPKLLSLYFAHQGSRVVATDLQDQSLFRRWGLAGKLRKYNYQVGHEDATHLSFPDRNFDLLYSISVVEHIPGNGDALAMREFARVLRDGGQLFVQVPFRHQSRNCYRRETSDGRMTSQAVWYERFYSRATLGRLRDSNLRLKQLLYTSERLPIDPLINRLPKQLRKLVAPFEWILAIFNVRLAQSPGKYPLGVILILEKSRTPDRPAQHSWMVKRIPPVSQYLISDTRSEPSTDTGR